MKRSTETVLRGDVVSSERMVEAAKAALRKAVERRKAAELAEADAERDLDAAKASRDRSKAALDAYLPLPMTLPAEPAPAEPSQEAK